MGDWPGSSVGFPGLSEQGQHPPLLSCSSVLEGPSCLLLLISLASLLCPKDPHGLEGVSEGIGPNLRAEQASLADWAGDTLVHYSLIGDPKVTSRCGNYSLPFRHPSGMPALSSLHLAYPLSPPMSYQFIWGFLLSPWASRSPTIVLWVP